MRKLKPRRHALLLLLLAMLCSSCASGSLSRPVPAPTIPPLPAEARQQHSPEFSEFVQRDIKAWLELLMQQSSQGKPASSPMTR